DGARHRVDRHARRVAPADAVRRLREDDVVGRAVLPEATVLPRDVGRPVAGDLGGRERARAQAARDAVEADPGDLDRTAPRGAAVVGTEGGDRAVQALERDDHAATRLHDRLAAEALVVPVGADRDAPRAA